MAEKGHWKFREINLTTGKPYFDWVPDTKGAPHPTEPAPLSPGERGNYNADIVAEAMEKRDEEKEARRRI